MGTWRITITGHGPHHNVNYENDANLMAEEFIDELRCAGHTDVKGEFELTTEQITPLGLVARTPRGSA
jgi:hypothetical protein